MAFAELFAKTAFSFLQGASQPEEMVEQAAALGMGCLGIADRDGLYGIVRAHQAARRLDLKLVIGAELTLASLEQEGHATSKSNARHGRQGDEHAERLIVLVENNVGYGNLCKLLTLGHAAQPKGQSLLELKDLEQHNAGLIAVLMPPRRRLLLCSGARDSQAFALPCRRTMARIVEIFQPRGALYAAIYRRLDGGDAFRESVVCDWSEHWQVPIVATNYPRFHQVRRKELGDVLDCMRLGIEIDAGGSCLEPNRAASLKGEAALKQLFRSHEAWLCASEELAHRCQFELSSLKYQFPCRIDAGETADGVLAKATWAGADWRYREGIPQPVKAQIEKELQLIRELGMAPYFLSAREVVQIARERDILCQGRGSAANSAVCYVLGITAVDPARSNLLFERFMSVERREPPDIDIDFEHERREEVIQELYRRYGRDRAAMVSEVICFRAKSALREVGKVFGLSDSQLGLLSSNVSSWDDVAAVESRCESGDLDVQSERVRCVLGLARELQGFPRHLSIHVGGFVLSAAPLWEVAPIEPARMVDRSVIPWDKDDLECLGFFKIDVLGLGMLTALRKSLQLIHETGPHAGLTFDPLAALAGIPAEDPEVYALAGQADTIGVFQIESRAQMAMLPRLRPRCFYDLVVEVALVRPGPIQGGMVHPYLRRRNGEEAVTLPHPDLGPILERTLGVPLFQEQVMQIAITGAGYTAGEADQLRRDMAAWKKTGKLMRHKQRLLDGFALRGITREFGEALFEQIKGFGDYGFPESHAASFALLAYASAWQKAHHPAPFVCALLNSQPMGFYSPRLLVLDAQKHGVEVRAVDVLQSNWDCSLEACDRAEQHREAGRKLAVRLGLRQIKGLGKATATRLLEARAREVFSSPEDLMRRAGLNKAEFEALAEAGALEPLVTGRRQALWRARRPRGEQLLAKVDWAEPTVILPKLEQAEQLVLDFERVGLSLQDHPMRHWRKHLKKRRVSSTAQLRSMNHGQIVCLAGMVSARQRPATAKGVVFITLEDETGSANLVVFARVFERYRHWAMHAGFVLVHGKVEKYENAPLVLEASSTTHEPRREVEVPPSLHVIVQRFEALEGEDSRLKVRSRDFH